MFILFYRKEQIKMQKAYDIFLDDYVNAKVAAENIGFEPYRYKCARCGEEVYLAAADSTSMIPHFRHRSGNSNVECEYYLGQSEVFYTGNFSSKSKKERVEFYFDTNTKIFYLGLSFSEDELSAYDQNSAVFELRVTTQSRPFHSIQINSRFFAAGVQNLIPIEKFSYSYFLSNTLNGEKRKYDLFNNKASDAATFFKMQTGDSSCKSKLVRSCVIYTNVPYLIVFSSQSQHMLMEDYSLPKEIKVDSTFKFDSMGKKFLGKVLTITSKTAQIESLLSSWGYKLENAESLTLLWPPAILSDGVSLIDADSAYLYSTFELEPHSSINVKYEDIEKIDDRLSIVAVKKKTKVYKKNAELTLQTSKHKLENYKSLHVMYKIESKIKIEDASSFLFNQFGFVPLSKGTIITLTPNSKVKHYLNGYLDWEAVAPVLSDFSKDKFLQDALMYYKRTEPFDLGDFNELNLSPTAFQYIEDCKKTGFVNSAVKNLIKDGMI